MPFTSIISADLLFYRNNFSVTSAQQCSTFAAFTNCKGTLCTDASILNQHKSAFKTKETPYYLCTLISDWNTWSLNK